MGDHYNVRKVHNCLATATTYDGSSVEATRRFHECETRIHRRVEADLRWFELVLVVSNEKLQDRAIRIIVETGATYEEALEAFRLSKEQVKTAIVYLLTGESVDKINGKLAEHQGKVRDVLDTMNNV